MSTTPKPIINENTSIRFYRSSNPSQSLKEAILKLDTIQHYPGQPVISYYYLEDNVTVDCVFALGLKEGIGSDSYSIISSRSEIIIDDDVIFGDLPDITELKVGDIILCQNTQNNKSFWVTRTLDSRVVTEIPETNAPLLVKSSTTGKSYWITNGRVKECSDYPTEKEFLNLFDKVNSLSDLCEEAGEDQKNINEKLDNILEIVLPLKILITPSEDTTLFEAGSGQSIEFSLSAQFGGKSVTDKCTWEAYKKSLFTNSEEKEQLELIVDGDSSKYQIVINEPGEFEISFKATYENWSEEYFYYITVLPKTIIGKIAETSTGNNHIKGKSLIDYFDWSVDDFIDLINSSNGVLEDKGMLIKVEESDDNFKRVILKSNKEDLIYNSVFKINEYPFVAIPAIHGTLSDIIDINSGQSILEEFLIFEVRGLYRSYENAYDYFLYIKKSGISSNRKTLSLIFKS